MKNLQGFTDAEAEAEDEDISIAQIRRPLNCRQKHLEIQKADL